jgi:hypothetical protein
MNVSEHITHASSYHHSRGLFVATDKFVNGLVPFGTTILLRHEQVYS